MGFLTKWHVNRFNAVFCSMIYTYLGHACFMLDCDGCRVVVDPFISPNALASHVDLAALRPNYILVSHGHEDHVADLLSLAQMSNATVISNFEIASWANKQGVKNTVGMNTGGKVVTDFGWVKLTAAVHSSVLPDGSPAGNPNGFIIQSQGKKIYYSGDSALTLDMQLVPLWAPELDAAVLPIGDVFTMDYKDAALAAQWVKARRVLPVHYDTFPPIQVNHEEVQAHFDGLSIPLTFSPIGEPVVI